MNTKTPFKKEMKASPFINDPFQHVFQGLSQSGKLDLGGQAICDLSFVGTRNSMKQLDISFTEVSTIEGLCYQPHIDSFIADNSELINFKNFRAIQNVSSISVKNTPVSQDANYKLSLAIVIGPSLRVIDGRCISKRIKNRAATYPPIASDLINCGWMAEYPCPDDNALEKIAQRLGLIERDDECDDMTSDFDQSSKTETDVEDLINQFTTQHNQMVIDAKNEMNEITLQDSSIICDHLSFVTDLESKGMGGSLCDKVYLLLKHYGFNVPQEDRSEYILHILADLLDKVKFEDSQKNIDIENVSDNISANTEDQMLSSDEEEPIQKITEDKAQFMEEEEDIQNEIITQENVSNSHTEEEAYIDNQTEEEDFENFTEVKIKYENLMNNDDESDSTHSYSEKEKEIPSHASLKQNESYQDEPTSNSSLSPEKTPETPKTERRRSSMSDSSPVGLLETPKRYYDSSESSEDDELAPDPQWAKFCSMVNTHQESDD